MTPQHTASFGLDSSVSLGLIPGVASDAPSERWASQHV